MLRSRLMMRPRRGFVLQRLVSRQYTTSPKQEWLTRPRMEEVVLVRHGESEGNIAFNRSVAGDHSLYSGAFMERHSSFWRLTDAGRDQATITGEWIKQNITRGSDEYFHAYFSSEYLRALETAALLDLPDASWRPEVMLRERDWGEYDLASQAERRNAYRQYETRRRRESLFWAPPGGESLAQVVQRIDNVLLYCNRRFGNERVIFVCHGELMWAFRLRLERLSGLKYREMQADPQTDERIHNCQVISYSRRDPTSGVLHDDFRFMRSVCPWDLSLSHTGWRQADRHSGWSNAEVLSEVERHPRIVNDDSILPGPPWQRALLVTKTARWRAMSEVEVERFPASARAALRAACSAHERAVKCVHDALRAAGFAVRTVDALGEPAAAMGWADVCLALGGDGTLLRAAAAAPQGMPVVGVNTDPQRSVGKHCSVSIDPKRASDLAAALARRLRQQAARQTMALVPRLRVSVTDVSGAEAGEEGTSPFIHHAINEGFLGEADPARPMDLEASIDGGPWQPWRTSGALVSTQRGASAWLSNAWSVRGDQASALLHAAVQLGHVAPEAARDLPVGELVAAANASLLHHDDDMRLQYLMRDAMLRRAEGAGGAGAEGVPIWDCHSESSPHGHATKIQVRPYGWNTVLSLDGLPALTLPADSCVLTFEIEPDRSRWLHTVCMDARQ